MAAPSTPRPPPEAAARWQRRKATRHDRHFHAAGRFSTCFHAAGRFSTNTMEASGASADAAAGAAGSAQRTPPGRWTNPLISGVTSWVAVVANALDGARRPDSRSTGPDRPRQAQTGPDRPRQAQTGPDRPRQAQTGPDRPRQCATGPLCCNRAEALTGAGPRRRGRSDTDTLPASSPAWPLHMAQRGASACITACAHGRQEAGGVCPPRGGVLDTG